MNPRGRRISRGVLACPPGPRATSRLASRHGRIPGVRGAKGASSAGGVVRPRRGAGGPPRRRTHQPELACRRPRMRVHRPAGPRGFFAGHSPKYPGGLASSRGSWDFRGPAGGNRRRNPFLGPRAERALATDEALARSHFSQMPKRRPGLERRGPGGEIPRRDGGLGGGIGPDWFSLPRHGPAPCRSEQGPGRGPWPIGPSTRFTPR